MTSTTTELTYADFKAKKKPRELSHTIITDDDAAEAYAAATERLRSARLRRDEDEIAAAEAEQAAAEQEVRDAALTLRLRALPRAAYAALKAEHPPRPEDDKDVQDATGDTKAKASWHEATFAPALVAACLVSPQVTVEQATEMARDLNDAEWAGLYRAAVAVNQRASSVAGLTFH